MTISIITEKKYTLKDCETGDIQVYPSGSSIHIEQGGDTIVVKTEEELQGLYSILGELLTEHQRLRR